MIEYVYSLLKSNWGIHIKVYGEVLEYDETKFENITCIKEKLFLYWDNTYSSEPRRIWTPEIKIIKSVLEELADVIIDISQFERTVVSFKGLAFCESDYQEEGLVVAIMKWLSKVFGFYIPEIPAYFEGSLNRYMFDFGVLDEVDYLKCFSDKIGLIMKDLSND